MINAIIFDLGGVIMDIHFHKCIDILKQHGCYFNIDLENPPDFFCDFEIGTISPQTFRASIKSFTQQPELSDDVIDTAWSSILGHVDKDKIDCLQALKALGYRLFLFSNTNELHTLSIKKNLNTLYPEVAANHENQCTLSALFEHFYFSNEIGLRKPNSDAFEHVMNAHQLNPNDTLFIDDLAANIHGAKQVGLQTLHITDTSFPQLLPKLLQS